MNTQWVRIAYCAVFLLALPAVFTAWGSIGGQGHLDLIAWHWKLALGGGLSACITGLVAALASDTKVLTRRAAAWMLLVLALSGAIGAVTVQSHLNEGTEEPQESEEETTAGQVRFSAHPAQTRRIMR